MKVEIQELDPCKRQLVVEAPEEEVRAAWTAACGRVQRDARLPGFRRGKVPMTLVRSRFGDEVRQAVAEALIPVVYRRAVDETQIRPVEDPEFRELQLEEGQPLRFTAVVEIKPAIALGEYRGVTARHSPRPVTEADVERTLSAIAEQRATLVTATRPARVGDFVVVDYELRPEGGELRREQGYAFEVGGGRVLPEMDEAVMGLEAGEERRVQVRFPDAHPREELRGRPGELTLRVVEVKEKEVPPLDDELARGSAPTRRSPSSGTRSGPASRPTGSARIARRSRRRWWTRCSRATTSSCPRAWSSARCPTGSATPARTCAGRASTRMRYAGTTRSSRPTSGRTPSARCAARSSSRRSRPGKGLTVGEGDVDAEIARLAQDSGRAPQAIRSLLERGNELEGMRLTLREAKTLALLVEHAKIEPAVAAEAAPESGQ